MIERIARSTGTIETTIDALIKWLSIMLANVGDRENFSGGWHFQTWKRITIESQDRSGFPGIALLAHNPYYPADEGYGQGIVIGVWVEMRDLGPGRVQVGIGCNDEIDGATNIMWTIDNQVRAAFPVLRWEHDGVTIDDNLLSGSLISLPDGRYIQAKEVELPLNEPAAPKRKKPKTKRERQENLQQLWEQNELTIPQMAKRLFCSEATINRDLKELGLATPRK